MACPRCQVAERKCKMISEKAANLIHAVQRAYQFTNDTGTQDETDILDAWEPVFAYIAYLESDVEELKAYRNGYNTNEKLPKEGQKVLVVKNGEYSTYNFSMHLWRSLLAPDFERWWPLPKGGGG